MISTFVHALSTRVNGKPQRITLHGIAKNEQTGKIVKEAIPGEFETMEAANAAGLKWKRSITERLSRGK